MEENNATTSTAATGTDFDSDLLKWILERNSSFTRDADTKNGITLAIVAVIASALFSSEAFITSASEAITVGDKVSVVLLLVMVVAAAMTLLCVFMSIKPRIKHSKKTLIFYDDISGIGDPELLHTLLTSEGFNLTAELEAQIVETARICSEKMTWHTRADWSLMVLTISMIVYVVRIILIGG